MDTLGTGTSTVVKHLTQAEASVSLPLSTAFLLAAVSHVSLSGSRVSPVFAVVAS